MIENIYIQASQVICQHINSNTRQGSYLNLTLLYAPSFRTESPLRLTCLDLLKRGSKEIINYCLMSSDKKKDEKQICYNILYFMASPPMWRKEPGKCWNKINAARPFHLNSIFTQLNLSWKYSHNWISNLTIAGVKLLNRNRLYLINWAHWVEWFQLP